MNEQLKQFTKTKTGDVVVPIHEALDPEHKNKESYPTGFDIIDQATTKLGTGGFKDGDLIVISGKSGHGKTLMAQNMIAKFLDNGIPSVFFSYEVMIDNVYETFQEMGCDEKPNIFTPKKNVTGDINWIKEKIIEADKNFFAKVVVIDHLDFVTSKNLKTDDHRRNEINNIITELKTFAIEQKKIIILLAHIVKTRERNLQNEDIADSRAIANLADYILFVGRELDENGEATGNNGMVRISKNRYTGKLVKMRFFVSDSQIIPSADQSFS